MTAIDAHVPESVHASLERLAVDAEVLPCDPE